MLLFFFCHKMQFLVYQKYSIHVRNESQEKKTDLEVKHKMSIEMFAFFHCNKSLLPGPNSSIRLVLLHFFILIFSTPEIAAIEPLHSQNVPGTQPDLHLFIFLQIIILGILPPGHLVCILIKVQKRMFFTQFIPKAFLSSSARKPENCLR